MTLRDVAVQLKMDRNRTNSRKISKPRAGETGVSSSVEVKRPRARETKRRHVDVVQPTGFDISQEDNGSPLQSQLMLSSQPVSSNIQTSDSEMPSPLLQDLSPLLGDGALDALDGWSLGSNLYFSDTGSGGGFLESQGSTAEEEWGVALGVLPLRSGEGISKKPKGRLTLPVVLREKLKPVSSQELSEVESPLALVDASVSQSSVRMTDDKSQDGGDDDDKEEMFLESAPVYKPKRNVKGGKIVEKVSKAKKDSRCVENALVSCPKVTRASSVSQSSVSQSSVKMSDDRSQDDDDDDEEMVLESVLANKPDRYVKSRKMIAKVVEAKKESHHVKDTLMLCPKVGIKVAEWSQGSSGADLFSESENLDLKSVSQSSLEVEYDRTSPAREVTAVRRGVRVRRKKEVEALVFKGKLNEKSKGTSAAKASKNCDGAKRNDDEVNEEVYLEKKDVQSASKTCQNIDKSKQYDDKKKEKYCRKNKAKSGFITSSQNVTRAKHNDGKVSQKKKDVQSTGKTPQNIDKLKQFNDKKEEKCSKKSNIKFGVIKTTQNVDNSKQYDNTKAVKYCKKINIKPGISNISQNVARFEPDIRIGRKTNSTPKDEGPVAETCGNVKKLKSDSLACAGETSVDVEHLKSNKPSSPVAAASQSVENLPKTSSRLSLKRVGLLAKSQNNIQDSGKLIAVSLSSAAAMDMEDTGSEPEEDKKNNRSSNARSCSAPTKSSTGKDNEMKRIRGGMKEVAAPARVVDLEKPTVMMIGQNKSTVKTPADDGGTREADDDNTAGDCRTRSPSLFGYESDSMLAPSMLAVRVKGSKKPAGCADGKGLNRSEEGKNASAGKTRPGTGLQHSNISQIKSGHLSMSSKSELADSGIAAGTPASFTLASRPGLAKLKTSTPLDQYRSFVGLDKPRKGAKKGKRPRDSGNESDFILDSNLSMLSPVGPAPQSKGRGQLREGGNVGEPKRVQEGKVVGYLFSELQAGEVVGCKSGAKRRRPTDVKEDFWPSDEVSIEEETSKKKKDSGETARTVPLKVTGTANAKTHGPQKKKSDNRGAASMEAKARQLYVEERLLQELDDIDQNYSLIIDD